MDLSHINLCHGALSQYAEADLGIVRKIEPIIVGLIHNTYRVDSTKGSFCLQRLHPKLASDQILDDYAVVTRHLCQHDFPAPQLLLSANGSPAVTDSEGRRWRLTTWLRGLNTSEIYSSEMLHSAAALLGKFHTVMLELDYTFRSAHPLHDTRHHLQNMREAVIAHGDDTWFARIAGHIEELDRRISPLLLPELPTAIVHGDPKISNFLFSDDMRAIAILDLDTCTQHTPLVDLGDAIRSWCHVVTSPEQIHDCRLDFFQALISGYISQAPPLSLQTAQLIPRAALLITLELASRFLTDVLRDCYFAWDHHRFPSRKHHNLQRAMDMLALADALEHTHEQQLSIVHSLISSISQK